MSTMLPFRRSMQAGALSALVLLGVGCKQQNHSPEQSAALQGQPAARGDQQIANDIQTRINNESALNGQNIQVTVANGVVTLSGTANNDASRALAGNDSGSVEGVRTVVNNLTVAPVNAAVPPTPAVVAPGPERQRDTRAAERWREKEAAARERAQNRAQNETQSRAENRAEDRAAPPRAAAPPPQQEAVQTVPPPPPAPPKPVVKTVTIPAGTVVPVRMTDGLDSATTQSNSTFHGALANDLIIDGMVAAPQGATVLGRVITAKDATHFSGASELSIELTRMDVHGQQVALVTDPFTKQGAGRGKNTATKAGGGAALGAIIGALAGGGKGAAIGAATGGGVGAGVNGVTRGQQVQIPSETLVNFRLQSPVSVSTSRAVGAPKTYESNDQPQLQTRD